MADVDLLPQVLNISAPVGDDVQVVLTIQNASCDGGYVDLVTGTTFSADFTANNTTYSALIAKDAASNKVTVTWSDAQTASAGAGAFTWRMKFTTGDITRTRFKGSFTLVAN